MLADTIDEIVANDGGLSWDASRVVSIYYWQKKLIDDLRHDFDSQDNIIQKLMRLVLQDEDVEKELMEETLKPDYRKVEALRHLTSLFLVDNLFYSEHIDLKDLKAWCVTYGYDFEMVKGLLGGEVKDRWAA